MGKNSRLETWLHYRVRVTISDTRYFVGIFLSYDRHMNIVLVDAEEYRKVKDKEADFKEIKRMVGLIMIRGENIVSFTAEQAPINRKRQNAILNKGIATGRGVPLNSYVPMQQHYNPHLGNPLGSMPTGAGLHAVGAKSLVPPAHAAFRPPSGFTGNLNSARPHTPSITPIPQPPMNQRPMGQPVIGQPPMNANGPPVNSPHMNLTGMNPATVNPPPMIPALMNPSVVNANNVNSLSMNPAPSTIAQPSVPNANVTSPLVSPHMSFPPNAKPPSE